MAKLSVNFLLFTLAVSVVSSKPENVHVTTSSAEPDPDTTNPVLSGSRSAQLISANEVTVPVNFHPINRHFPRRHLSTAPLNHRPCHHLRHELLRRGLQIPYGNDMIFSDEEKARDTDRSSNGFVAHIPAIKTKHNPRRKTDKPGEVEAEDDGSMKIAVKLIKNREGGEGEREYPLRRNIRKFRNHLV